MRCTGRGDQGDHCCWINGEICGFLFVDRGGTPRCELFDEWGRLHELEEWRYSPVGVWFAANYPGYTCKDWPQNIPEVMANTKNLCCWGSDG